MELPQTPMLRQYHREKSNFKEHLLFFRVGDFFELFFEDAVKGAQLLDIALTKRNGVPMCGVPAHSIDNYLKRLLKLKVKVALCDQVTSPQKGTLVKREVTEKITPGTVSNSDYLESSSNNYLMALHRIGDEYACCWIDVSTGDFRARRISADYQALYSIVINQAVKELLVSQTEFHNKNIRDLKNEINTVCITALHDWFFSMEEGELQLKKILKLTTLKSFNLEGKNKPLLPVISAILQYVQLNNSHLCKRVHSLSIQSSSEFMELDSDTIYNLELYSSIREHKKEYSLIHVLDGTSTKMGHRCLAQWLSQPLLNQKDILSRLDRVNFFYKNDTLLSQVISKLKEVNDIPRLLTKVATYKAHPRDLVSLRKSIESAFSIIKSLIKENAIFLVKKEIDLEKIQECIEQLMKTIVDDPPVSFGNSYVIRKGYDKTLDTLRHTHENGKKILDDYFSKEQFQFSHTMRIKYNKIIGYFIEASHSLRGKLPKHFILRQTLTNCDRYKTVELSEIESNLLNAENELLAREQNLFQKLLEDIIPHIPVISSFSSFIAEIDVLSNFANNAKKYHYTYPQISTDNALHIKQGRHPVIEFYSKNDFIPNDMKLEEDNYTFTMLTAPNMAGKSTYLRQNALIVIMGQIGSFVPAEYAKIGIRDKIFCRVGASDNIIKGDSTFLMEMSETAYIIRNAEIRSLVIIDEIGRGTSVSDGQALAYAIAEYFIGKKIFTIFATHYHELRRLNSPNIQPLTLSITMHNDQIVFTRHIKPGAAERSYGIEVAQLAGVDSAIIQRAKIVLESSEAEPTSGNSPTLLKNKQRSSQLASLPFIEETGNEQSTALDIEVQNKLASLAKNNIDSWTPIAALQFLSELKDAMKGYSTKN